VIKINLLVERKARKVRVSEKDQKFILIGIMILGGAGLAVFLLVHQPLAEEAARLAAANAELEKQNNEIAKQTKDLAKLQAAVKAAEDQEQAIDKLRGARATPAWLLWELSNILTRGHQPSLTAEMQRRVESDPNRKWQQAWDPKKVWITEFEERSGRFKLNGGAQSDSDMTQLALRLQASMFFDNVQPEGGNENFEKEGGSSYYNFTISGKVRY
jgi:Tfp pilus assembly protein PilN